MDITFSSFGIVEILLALAAATDFILPTVIFLKQAGDRDSRYFIISSYWVTFWVLSMLAFQLIESPAFLTLPAKALYICGILITHFFYLFTFDFLGQGRGSSIPRRVYGLTAVGTGASILLILFSTSIVSSAYNTNSGKFITFGALYLPFAVLMFSYVIMGYRNLLGRYKQFLSADNKLGSQQVLYVIIGTGVSIGVSLIGNMVLPYFGNFSLHWVGPIINISFVVTTTYAILRYHLFDLKVIATEILIFSLWLILFIRLLISSELRDQLVNGSILLATIFVGILLIRSVIREVAQREKIERLSEEKSEFMTFASHEIRNPITAMRGYASLIVDGTVDHASPEVKAVAQKILIGGNDVLNLIAQFLSKSKMELGQISYNSAPFDLGAAASSIADGYVPHAELRGLTLEKKIDASHQYIIKADEGKVKEVIGNLIDNSLKYTVLGGVTVAVDRHGVAVRLTISDTGVGIAPETLPHLFKKFSRADAQKVNLLGTGVGLYLAKTFIEAMGGRIWAESEGKDKGSRFILEFPAQSGGASAAA